MKCPNCGTGMKRIPKAGSLEEYVCSGCGMNKKKDSIGLDPMKTELASLSDQSQPKRIEVSGQQAKIQLERAKRNTEIRRAVKEISGKLNDLEIQFDRRVEELQMLVVKLTKALDLKDK